MADEILKELRSTVWDINNPPKITAKQAYELGFGFEIYFQINGLSHRYKLYADELKEDGHIFIGMKMTILSNTYSGSLIHLPTKQ